MRRLGDLRLPNGVRRAVRQLILLQKAWLPPFWLLPAEHRYLRAVLACWMPNPARACDSAIPLLAG
jgi:hypothetical protein